ncbi:hypothetical protein [Bermanella sp. R86510]|uniref:hypothetical protein n=1 Tax=unclassified Bermanella TaxID=2627862 RepID=UPI0037C51033
METMVIFGAVIVLTLIGSIFIKSYLEKKRIEMARKLVDLHDDLKRMQNAMAVLPDIYLDTPTKVFMIRRLIQLLQQVQESGNQSEGINIQIQELEYQLDKTQQRKDDSVKRLSQCSKIAHPDTAHEIKVAVKFLHGQMLASVKNGLIPKSHGARITKNLKVMAHRLGLDLNYNLAKQALQTNKWRPALGKLRMTKSIIIKSPIKQYLEKQRIEVDELIKKTEAKLNQVRIQNQTQSQNKLAEGVDKIQQEEDWESKKNIYDD